MDDVSLKSGVEKISLAKHPIGWFKSFISIAKLSWHCDKNFTAMYLKQNGNVVFTEGSNALEYFNRAIEKNREMRNTEDDLK